MAKFKGKWRIESARLQTWDYGWNGRYFITICTANRRCFFDDFRSKQMVLSETGQLAHQFWHKIPAHFPFVLLDASDHTDPTNDPDTNGGNNPVDPNHPTDIDDSVDPINPTENTVNISNTDKSTTNSNDPFALTPGQKRLRNQEKTPYHLSSDRTNRL